VNVFQVIRAIFFRKKPAPVMPFLPAEMTDRELRRIASTPRSKEMADYIKKLREEPPLKPRLAS
jgi:hypothetical protein